MGDQTSDRDLGPGSEPFSALESLMVRPLQQRVEISNFDKKCWFFRSEAEESTLSVKCSVFYLKPIIILGARPSAFFGAGFSKIFDFV